MNIHSSEYTSNKPYLFRAIFEWLLDNDATPHMLVDAAKPNVDVPQEHVKDLQIVLNISPSAVQGWTVDNEAVSFSARFAGVPRQIYVPMNAILALYAQENGLGMVFPAEEDNIDNNHSDIKLQERTQEQAEDKKKTSLSPEKKPIMSNSKRPSHLKIIK